jgi:IS4 transposase
LNGGYSLSHNLVTGGIYQDDFFYPTNCELYQRRVDVRETSTFITKMDMAQAMLEQWIDKVDNVLMDSWYSSQKILKTIVDKEKIFFTMLKRDRLFKTNHKTKRQLQEWNKYLDPRKYKIITLGKQTFTVQEKIGFLPKVGKVKILFSKFYDKKTKLSKKIHYLCTNNLDLTIEEILVKYKDRWPIETFYKDVKQNLGFEKCIIRKEIGVKRHFLMSFIAHSLLVFSRKKQSSCGELKEI